MTVHTTSILGVLVFEPKQFHDSRGYFFEMFRENVYAEHGLVGPWVQDNASFSHHGVLRGLHYQWPNPQGKLVSVAQGEIWDVAVDIRRDSPTYRQWHAEVLNETNRKQLWVPEGFAHGFVVLSESALVNYKVTAYFDAAADGGIAYNDPDLAVEWPVEDVIISAKDQALLRLEDIDPSRLP